MKNKAFLFQMSVAANFGYIIFFLQWFQPSGKYLTDMCSMQKPAQTIESISHGGGFLILCYHCEILVG